jgi:prepilin-type N-terminal cleavage/methylation domain-containing protein
MTKEVSPGTCRGVRRYNAFTLIELIVAVGIIAILSALILSTVGYARKKGARARAETEIAAMSAALENYKADNAVYVRDCTTTDALVASSSGDPTTYQNASLYLYKQLSGDTNANLQPPAGAKSYFAFKSIPPSTDGTSSNGMLSITRSGSTYTVNYIRDPFGNSYGYSTLSANYLDWQNYDACVSGGGSCQPPSCPRPSSSGYNPTFDLWSTAGTTSGSTTDRNQWIKNW